MLGAPEVKKFVLSNTAEQKRARWSHLCEALGEYRVHLGSLVNPAQGTSHALRLLFRPLACKYAYDKSHGAIKHRQT